MYTEEKPYLQISQEKELLNSFSDNDRKVIEIYINKLNEIQSQHESYNVGAVITMFKKLSDSAKREFLETIGAYHENYTYL